MIKISVRKLSNILGTSRSTLRGWLKDLPIKCDRERRCLLSPVQLSAIMVVADLRRNGATARRMLETFHAIIRGVRTASPEEEILVVMAVYETRTRHLLECGVYRVHGEAVPLQIVDGGHIQAIYFKRYLAQVEEILKAARTVQAIGKLPKPERVELAA